VKVTFSDDAWADYLYWQDQDRKTLRRINRLIRDITRSPDEGLGQPEMLRGSLSGYSSRRINSVDRITYRVINATNVELIGLRGHYN
jgi:toxin YoeB